MTPIEIHRRAVVLLNCLAEEAISPRKRFELANVAKKQIFYLKTKQPDKEIASNLNLLHNHISKTLQAFPNLKDKYPTAMTLLAEIETSARKSAEEFTYPSGKSDV